MFPDIAQYISKVQTENQGGQVYVLALMDCCVWPSNSAYLTACTQAFTALLATSPKHAGHLQMPLPQAQTHQSAVLKHRRTLEDSMVTNGLDIMRPVSLMFDKSNLSAGDKREPWHPCLLVTATAQDNNAWLDSSAAQNRSIGPCPLIRVADMLGFDPDSRPGASQRKGVPAHSEVITAYLRGMPFQENDQVVLVDILPNRQAEFARAAVSRMLDNTARRPDIRYCAFFRSDQKDVVQALESMVYKEWDSSGAAPARTRPVDALPDPTLSLLTWSNGRATFPESIFQKFPEGSAAFSQIQELKKALVAEFPDSASAGPGQSTQPGSSVGRARASGRPDFSIDGGQRPLDFTLTVEKEHVPVSSFTVQRKAYCAGTRAKPAIVVAADLSVWLGNETNEEISLTACELCGFNLGSFEEKVVAGLGETELSGICFRFASDLVLVSSERQLTSLAEFAHKCCTVQGIANFELANHEIQQKMYPPASESEEAVPVPYRFSLAPARNGKCNVFRPNALSNAEAARHATIGAAFVGHFDKIPKNDVATVVWEVTGQALFLAVREASKPLKQLASITVSCRTFASELQTNIPRAYKLQA
ncbi:unnamed protein product [Cladocopium goreaui]|uniref:7,8-didemethyl-8-hydroxy-5-deazariboflavin synthase n=1 Tax=Cladocopium goreaui TaxID=2562237 RepID=A0A9P1BWX6_9DINO|nr:unnamed protein product [Cladocopium goreaui]